MRKLTLLPLLLLALLVAPASPQGGADVRSISKDWLTDVALGNVAGFQIFHKFGSALATTTLAPVARSNVYRMPKTATALEVLSSSASDTLGGVGAARVTITGLDQFWNEVTLTADLNGTTPVPLGIPLLRVYRWGISESGTYASDTVASQVGTLTIQELGAGPIWSQIPPLIPGSLGAGQARIGMFTVPKGKTVFVLSYSVTVDSTKTVNAFLIQRCDADDVDAPYSGIFKNVRELRGLAGPWNPVFQAPEGPFTGPCDLGFFAAAEITSAQVTVDFELLIADSDLVPQDPNLFPAN